MLLINRWVAMLVQCWAPTLEVWASVYLTKRWLSHPPSTSHQPQPASKDQWFGLACPQISFVIANLWPKMFGFMIHNFLQNMWRYACWRLGGVRCGTSQQWQGREWTTRHSSFWSSQKTYLPQQHCSHSFAPPTNLPNDYLFYGATMLRLVSNFADI